MFTQAQGIICIALLLSNYFLAWFWTGSNCLFYYLLHLCDSVKIASTFILGQNNTKMIQDFIKSDNGPHV